MEELHLNFYVFTDLSAKVPFPVPPIIEIRLKVLHDLSLNQKQLRESKKNRGKLDLYLQGILIQANLPYPDKLFFQQLLTLHYNCSSRVSYRLPTVYAVCYVKLIRTVRCFRPTAFLNRYPNIEYVEAGKAVRQYSKQFREFLSGFNRITALSIRFAGFGQDFYDELPQMQSLRSLITLIVLDTFEIDFSCLTKFALLTVFKTNLMNVEAVLNLIEGLNMFGDYEFCFKNGHRAVVLKQKPTLYFLLVYQRQQPLSKLTGSLKKLGSQASTSGFSSEDSMQSRPDENTPYDEPLDCGYTRSMFPNLNWPELVTKVVENGDLLCHWFDRPMAEQSF